jgi:uncharacterized membrane protein
VYKRQARLGEGPWKGAFALALVVCIALMATGYSAAARNPVHLYFPPTFLWHVNNLLVLVAFFFLGAGHAKAWPRRVVRHPMLTAVKIWAVAHLLVNGTLHAWILFGGMLVWAGMSVGFANRRDGAWAKPPASPLRVNLIHGAASVALFVVVALIHTWLGVRPFPG